MSNFAISNQTPLFTSPTPLNPKTEKPVINAQTTSAASLNKDDIQFSGKSVGKVAAVSLLGGGAIAGAGGLLIHSAKHLTGTGAFGATFLGIGLLGVGALTAVGGGIGGTVGAAFADSKGSGAALGAAVSGALAGGAAFAVTRDLKTAALFAAPAALVGGAGGYWGSK